MHKTILTCQAGIEVKFCLSQVAFGFAYVGASYICDSCELALPMRALSTNFSTWATFALLGSSYGEINMSSKDVSTVGRTYRQVFICIRFL